MQVTVAEAARILGIPEKTVRRKVRTGELRGAQVHTAQGLRWMVEVPDGTPHQDPHNEDCAALREVIALLKEELEARRREVQELHVLLQASQAALPAPRSTRRWWKWWRGGG